MCSLAGLVLPLLARALPLPSVVAQTMTQTLRCLARKNRRRAGAGAGRRTGKSPVLTHRCVILRVSCTTLTDIPRQKAFHFHVRVSTNLLSQSTVPHRLSAAEMAPFEARFYSADDVNAQVTLLISADEHAHESVESRECNEIRVHGPNDVDILRTRRKRLWKWR